MKGQMGLSVGANLPPYCWEADTSLAAPCIYDFIYPTRVIRAITRVRWVSALPYEPYRSAVPGASHNPEVRLLSGGRRDYDVRKGGSQLTYYFEQYTQTPGNRVPAWRGEEMQLYQHFTNTLKNQLKAVSAVLIIIIINVIMARITSFKCFLLLLMVFITYF